MASVDATSIASLAQPAALSTDRTRTRSRPAVALWGWAFLAAFTAVSGDSAAEGFLASAQVSEPAEERPFVIKLRREAVPVRHRGKVISYKTSYSGPIHIGFPRPQEFRVVFDTGSGHVILPSSECYSAACLKHNRYDVKGSDTAVAVNSDGSPVLPGNQSEQVTIGFGTGKVVGEFVHDRVCLGPASQQPGGSSEDSEVPCLYMNTVAAIEMSQRPFTSVRFDGIVGLGLPPLAVTSNFSFFHLFAGTPHHSGRKRLGRFAVFLGGGDGPNGEAEESEIAFGGHDPRRLLGPAKRLAWVQAAKPELGHWQVKINALRVGGRKLDWCTDGSCFGIMDTGTSHLGIPGDYESSVAEMLTRSAEGHEDCRRVEAPILEIELQGFTITLHPRDYMRQLPLAGDVPLRTAGVSPTSHEDVISADISKPPEAAAEDQDGVLCKPKLMPVNMPLPLGPKLFILGEPVLQRYYTAYDTGSDPPRIGLGLAAHARNAVPSAGGAAAIVAESAVQELSSTAPNDKQPRYDDPIFLAQVSAEESPQVMETRFNLTLA